jgi:hypothetical protein
MVTLSKRLAARFKAAVSWQGFGDDLHTPVSTPKGNWVVKVRMTTEGSKGNVHRYYVAITTPDGKKLKAPGGSMRLQEDAKKEANIWVKDLKKNGDVKLVGWTSDT